MKKSFAIIFACSLCFGAAAAGTNEWLTVLDGPLPKSQAEKKLVLVNFTGSDWSPGSIKFNETILDAPEFKSYAQTNLELVEVDFPTNKPQSDAIKLANDAWKQRYNVRIFPTLILMDSNGRELGLHVGCTGDAAAFVGELNGWMAKAASVEDPDAGKWIANLSVALARARATSKLVLMDFTGSDWCPWCIKLDNETFSQPAFLDYAKKNLVLVKVDFLRHTEQSADVKAYNDALATKYGVEGFPTEIALKPDGTVIWKNAGYLDGGPAAMIAELDKAKHE